MEEFITEEFLLPSLVIGVPEEVFWTKTPKTIQVYFRAYNKMKEQEGKEWAYKAWLTGLYTKAAISTSVFVAGLYDGKHKPKDYPKPPKFEDNEQTEEEYTQEQIELERSRVVAYLKSLGKKR